jgi:hypothetical protein
MSVTISGSTGITLPDNGSLSTSVAGAMVIDSAGRVTTPLQPAFGATRSAGNVNENTYYVFNDAAYNIGGHYSTSTGKFTAPVAGRYQINVNLMSADTATLDNKHWQLVVNASTVQRVYSSNGSAVHHRWNWNGILSLAANDYVEVYSNDLRIYGSNGEYGHFSGYLLG